MTITPAQQDSLHEAAKPLVEWMLANCHPHCKIIVEVDSAELVERIAKVRDMTKECPNER